MNSPDSAVEFDAPTPTGTLFDDPDWPDNYDGPMCDCQQLRVAYHPIGHEGFCSVPTLLVTFAKATHAMMRALQPTL